MEQEEQDLKLSKVELAMLVRFLDQTEIRGMSQAQALLQLVSKLQAMAQKAE